MLLLQMLIELTNYTTSLVKMIIVEEKFKLKLMTPAHFSVNTAIKFLMSQKSDLFFMFKTIYLDLIN